LLKSLSIRNIVLIEEAEVDFTNGLCVLTGETGSGKSIFIDALMLALGVRSSSRLLRDGTKNGSVTAVFDISGNIACQNMLRDLAIDFGDEVILRRVLNEDGKTRAFINDVIVGQGCLSALGERLVEIHGQHEQRGLLNPSFHRDMLDRYGNLEIQKQIVSDLYFDMKTIGVQLQKLTQQKEDIAREIDYLEYVLEELDSIDVKIGEEEELNSRRILLVNRDKILNILESARNMVSGSNGVAKSISNVQNYISRNRSLGENLLEDGQNAFDLVVEDFEKSLLEFNEGIGRIDLICGSNNFEKTSLEKVEERLSSIRSLARKYSIGDNDFSKFRDKVEKKLGDNRNKNIMVDNLSEQFRVLSVRYLEEAMKLQEQRKLAAKQLEDVLGGELAVLSMGNTRFEVEFRELPENHWNANGIDAVRFVVAVNVGTVLDDLSKVASGGELSRCMLAIEVVLAKLKLVPTVIFDEIDSGVGGVVADMVGERLKKLGENFQVFVITHLPQIASKGHSHFGISKEIIENRTYTKIEKLDHRARVLEIAKMLGGKNIREETIKIAEKLITSEEKYD
jgi:DNA repair protein RecN (Recombination protein N)